jgi:hypothetical protein
VNIGVANVNVFVLNEINIIGAAAELSLLVNNSDHHIGREA